MKKAVFAIALAAAAFTAPSAQAASFVHVTPPPKKLTVKDMIAGKLYQHIECEDDCTFQAKLAMRKDEAERLGFDVPKGEKGIFISEVDGTLKAGEKRKLYMPLTRKARRLLKRAKTGAVINGGATAQGDGEGGSSIWYRNCKWERG